MYYCALSLGVYCSIYFPDFLSLVRFGVFWSTVSVNFLLRKYYNYLNKIDMVLLRIIAIYVRGLPGACPGIRKRGAQNLKAFFFFCFSIFQGGGQAQK